MRTEVAFSIALLLAAALAPGVVGSAAGLQSADASQGTACTVPVTMHDATGTEVTVEEVPERVVTLNPSAAQTMWEIGAREKVVGLTMYAAYLEGSGEKANVSGAGQIVMIERVVAQEPDLVLAPNATSRETVEKLRESGLTVYHFPEAETIEDVYAKTRTVGRLVGECEGAEDTVAWMQERLATVDEAVESEPRPDVLYVFFGFTAGEGTFIHEIIETAGGNNVAAEYGIEGYRQPSPEVVVEADPDWIVLNSNDPELPGGAPFNDTTAVREGQTVVLPVQHLNQPAPRIVLAIAALAERFHPEAYAEVNATATEASTEADATATARTSETSEGTTSPTPVESPGQAGLGLASAIAAVAIAVLVARGRS